MEFLNRLLWLDSPSGATLRSSELHLRGLFPLWLGLGILLLGAVGAFMLYAREQAPLGSGRRFVLAGLRTLLLAVILLLLMRPVLVVEFGGERPAGVAVLLDNSQSMKLAERRDSAADRLRVAIAKGQLPPATPLAEAPPVKTPLAPLKIERATLVRDVLGNPQLDLLDSLRRHGALRLFLFGQQLRRVSDEKTEPGQTPAPTAGRLLAEFNQSESRTALADALNEILLNKEGDLPGALVLITDGQDNASKLPLDEVALDCARLKVPLYIYGVGATEGGNLQLKDLNVPETIFYDDTVSVPVRWRCRGFKQGTAVLTLTMGGKVVARRELPVKEGDDLRELLSFTPQKKGTEREEKTDLAVSIEIRGNADARDEMKRPIQVIDRKVRVLYVENTPRWEFKFLQPTLLRDRRVEASFLLLAGDPRLLEKGPPFLPSFPPREKLFGYDLLILGDVPAGYFDSEQQSALQDFVKEGGGLVVIAGRYNAPSSYGNTGLAEVIPVEFLPVKAAIDPDARPQAYHPLLTPIGERSDMLALADTPQENLKTWKELPGFYWHFPLTKLRPGAQALLVHPAAKMGDQSMPLLARHFYGKGQVLFMAVEETWRWRANAQDRYFTRFWGQVIYQLGLPHLLGGSKKIQLALEQADAVLGAPGYIHARLFDADYRPLKEERVAAELEYLDAKPGQERKRTLMLEAVPGQPGEYRALLAHDAPGRYELRLTGPEGSVLPYRVNLPARHEQEPLGLALDSLREAARQGGGKFYREEDLHRLSDEIQTRKTPFTHRQEVLFWGPLALLLFVAVVTAEWLVRKFSNLS